MMISNNVKHSSKTNEHYTPAGILSRVRSVIGEIDLDPASCRIANETVQAKQYFTKDDDGLSKDWFGKVFLNPPGGRITNQSSQKVWWYKLLDEWNKGNVEEAIFLSFSLDLLQTSQSSSDKAIGKHLLCIPSKRIRFIDELGNVQKSPTHANMIAYLPSKNKYHQLLFISAFENLGTIVNKSSISVL